MPKQKDSARTLFSPFLAKPTWRWLGLMSGTSCDGVDVAVVDILEEDGRARVVNVVGDVHPFDGPFANQLRADLHNDVAVSVAARWDSRLAEAFVLAVDSVLSRCVIDRETIDGIGLSGHTFAHLPDAEPPTTLQLGNPAVVASALATPVVAGFRAADLAHGGEGAPLVPAADRVLFADPREDVVVLNFGGIGNVTWLPRGDAPPLGADSGPANLLLDAAVVRFTNGRESFDRDGLRAARGQADPRCVSRWLDHPFFFEDSTGVRSTGREQFGQGWVEAHWPELVELGEFDALASIVAFIAEATKLCCHRLLPGRVPHRVLVGGGGAKNSSLMTRLAATLSDEPDARTTAAMRVEPLNARQHGVCADLREAAAFAILGHEYLHRRPGSFPTTTGCRSAQPLGTLWLP